MATGIAPPKEHLELGDRVRFHHRACVGRVRKHNDEGYWHLPKEDRPKPHWEAIRVEGGEPPQVGEDGEFGLGSNFIDRMKVSKGRNKTIICWPAEGEGVVVGMIRRGIGRSVAGYTSGYEYPEYEPGYFEAHEWHWLYLVKTSLQQKEPVYVPLWACTPIAD